MSVRLARYQLLKRLASGGMGEVFLARVEGPRGFEKLVVVKRILPHLASDPQALELFLDEARLAASLSHPNVAQIFELGEVDGTWFIAMEYVSGIDLRQVMKRAADAGVPVPLGVTVRIIAELAGALDYVHRATDARGARLGLVHRDVSPHNVMLGFEGAVKLIDFGIARSPLLPGHTRSGELRGKIAYMSPEQLEARKLDGRSDQYALGVVLWELLAGRRRFIDETEPAMMRLILEEPIAPPSRHRAGVPAELETLCLRALERDVEARFPDAAALRTGLEHAAAQLRLEASVPDLQRWLRELLGDAEAPAGESLGESATHVRGRADPDDPTRTAGDRPAQQTRVSRSRLIGRTADLAAVEEAFANGARLVTLLGTAGSGKTRLAAELQKRAGRSTWFCDLTETRSAAEICSAVAGALGVRLVGERSADRHASQVGQALAAAGEGLFVLDNFEQVAAYAAQTVEVWLNAAPGVRFLVTSREPLRLPAEHRHEVQPFATTRDAVEMFAERARLARSGRALDAAELEQAAALVERLERLPLAIELAASQAASFSPARLLERLEQRRGGLDGPPGGSSSARQASLQKAIDWSWSLLAAHEQAALAQCSVFRGGFSLEAAEAVVDLTQFEEPVLDTLQALRERSLLYAWEPARSGGEPRLGLLESIREFAHEELVAAGGEAAVAERHSVYFLHLGAELRRASGRGGLRPLERLMLERENLAALFGRPAPGGEVQAVARELQVSLILDPLFAVQGPITTQLALLDAQLERAERVDVPKALQVAALEVRGRARSAHGELDAAQQDLELAARAVAGLDDKALEARIEASLGAVHRLKGEPKLAQRHLERAGALGRDDPPFEARVLSELAALLVDEGELAEARRLYLAALPVLQQAGDTATASIVLASVALLDEHDRAFGAAREGFQAAMALQRANGDLRSQSVTLVAVASLDFQAGEWEQGMQRLDEAAALAARAGARRFGVIIMLVRSSVQILRGDRTVAEGALSQILVLAAEVGDARYVSEIRAAVDALREGRHVHASAARHLAIVRRALQSVHH